jgi:hypothetical protein
VIEDVILRELLSVMVLQDAPKYDLLSQRLVTIDCVWVLDVFRDHVLFDILAVALLHVLGDLQLQLPIRKRGILFQIFFTTD